MLKNNPSRRLLVSVKPTTPFVLSPISYFRALSPSLPVAIVFCLSLFHNWILFSLAILLFAFLSPSQSAQRASDNGSNTAAARQLCRLAPQWWAVPVLCPAAAAGYTWREEITGSWSTRPNEPADHGLISVHLFLSLSIKFTRMYSRQSGGCCSSKVLF